MVTLDLGGSAPLLSALLGGLAGYLANEWMHRRDLRVQVVSPEKRRVYATVLHALTEMGWLAGGMHDHARLQTWEGGFEGRVKRLQHLAEVYRLDPPPQDRLREAEALGPDEGIRLLAEDATGVLRRRMREQWSVLGLALAEMDFLVRDRGIVGRVSDIRGWFMDEAPETLATPDREEALKKVDPMIQQVRDIRNELLDDFDSDFTLRRLRKRKRRA